MTHVARGLWQHLERKLKRRLESCTPCEECGYPLFRASSCPLCNDAERRSKFRNREDLAHELFRNHGLYLHEQADLIVNAIIDAMKDALIRGYRLELKQFGVFEVRYYAPKVLTGYYTGTENVSRPKRKPFFKMNRHNKSSSGKTKKPHAYFGTVNRYDLADTINEQFNLGQKFSRRIINTFLQSILDALESGLRVDLYGFGAFVPMYRDSYMAYSKEHGSVPCWEHLVIKFKASKQLVHALSY